MNTHSLIRIPAIVLAMGLVANGVEAGETPLAPPKEPVVITHGPILGAVTAGSMSIWARTSRAGEFNVRYGLNPDRLDRAGKSATTTVEHDNTAVVRLADLAPDTRYYYEVYVGRPLGNAPTSRKGSFRTLPDPAGLKTAQHNPDGLFNFSFEFACGNNQDPKGGLGPSLPGFDTLLRDVKDRVHFAILNGDWLYETARDYSPAAWRRQVAIPDGENPSVVRIAPTITGVWENYKTYLSDADNLAEWHRNVASYYTFDDHEILNDVYGSGTAGYRNRRAVFRDIAVRAWYDYLGWANPVAHHRPIQFGQAEMTAGSDVLVDRQADFTKIDFAHGVNLHVHWGTPDAGVRDIAAGDVEGGDPNANVYDVLGVLDQHRLRVHPAAAATRTSSYSIGRCSYGTFKVSNCRFFLLDTRSHRQLHDIRQPAKKGLSMLGAAQRDWLLNWMKKGDADFYFVVSSVNFMIPHVGGGGASFDAAMKDDAWTVFLDEREQLIEFWDSLTQPVFVLTGDLHNSFVVKITENVWEFASGPHNSVNHRPEDEGNRPVNGPFQYGPRACDIRWSTTALGDIPRGHRMFPHFCVVQINNVFNNPLQRGGTRWVAYPRPHVVFQFYDALTGELRYAEAIHAR